MPDNKTDDELREDLVTAETEAAEQRDERGHTNAGRPPTPDEEAAAEKAASRVDNDAVRGPYREYTKRAANTEGEGAV